MTIPRVGFHFTGGGIGGRTPRNLIVPGDTLNAVAVTDAEFTILMSKAASLQFTEPGLQPSRTTSSRITSPKIITDTLNVSAAHSESFQIILSKSASLTFTEPGTNPSLTQEDKVAAPTGLTGVDGVLNTVDLDWTDNATNETEYRIQRAVDVSGSPGTYSDYVTGLPANTETDSPTQPYDSTYWYRVYCTDGTYFSDYSNEVSVYKPPM